MTAASGSAKSNFTWPSLVWLFILPVRVNFAEGNGRNERGSPGELAAVATGSVVTGPRRFPLRDCESLAPAALGSLETWFYYSICIRNKEWRISPPFPS